MIAGVIVQETASHGEKFEGRVRYRMHALACACGMAFCVDLFAKDSVRRGQKPLPRVDGTFLFEDVGIKDELNAVTSKSFFRRSLVSLLVGSCFRLSLPLPEQENFGTKSGFIGTFGLCNLLGALNCMESALEVMEVCRPCVLWHCDGRTYTVGCYLKLPVRLCRRIYDTREV